MEKQSVKTASSSDSTSEDSDSDREVKSEFVKSEPQYSPGGGDSPNESYTPAKPKKEKPYRPGGFFFDDDEEEEEDEDNEMAGFIQGEDDVDEEEDEEDSNPFFNSGKELQINKLAFTAIQCCEHTICNSAQEDRNSMTMMRKILKPFLLPNKRS